MSEELGVRLRVMTWKSTLTFGKYQGCTVRQAYDAEGGNQGAWYLAWIYYSIPGLSFCEEVLDAIHLSPEYRIEKPSKKPSMLNKWKTHYYEVITADMTDERKTGVLIKDKSIQRRLRKAKDSRIKREHRVSKALMTVFNQAPKK